MKHKQLRIGDKVSHPTKGIGTLMNIRNNYAGFKYKVDFNKKDEEPQWYLRSGLTLVTKSKAE